MEKSNEAAAAIKNLLTKGKSVSSGAENSTLSWNAGQKPTENLQDVKKRTLQGASVSRFAILNSNRYLRMKVIEPLKFVTETEERPSPTSPTYFRPS